MAELMETYVDLASRYVFTFSSLNYPRINTFSPKRNIKALNEILSLAKLKESDIFPTSQAIYFADGNVHNCTEEYKLLELDKNLADHLEKGEQLLIKGSDDENAVLCTKDKTYDLLECETSNSLLLVNGLRFPADIKSAEQRQILDVTITGIFHTYLSPVPGRPKLRKLKELLLKSAYRGPELEYQIIPSDLYTLENLQSVIQASNEELENVLKDLNVIVIDGKIRILELEYHFRVLSYMLKLLDENSWPLDGVEYDETIQALEDIVPIQILNTLFDLYAERVRIIDGVQLYRYTDKVAKFFAQVLLHKAGRFSLADFLQAWKESVPEGMEISENMLHGIAVVDKKSDIIKNFPEENLPENIVERFSELFKAQENWTIEQITPYIQ